MKLYFISIKFLGSGICWRLKIMKFLRCGTMKSNLFLPTDDSLWNTVPFLHTNNHAIRQDTNPDISPRPHSLLMFLNHSHTTGLRICCIMLTLQRVLWLLYAYNRHMSAFATSTICYKILYKVIPNQITGKSFTCWHGTLLFANSNTLWPYPDNPKGNKIITWYITQNINILIIFYLFFNLKY